MEERWKDIKGFEKHSKISSTGKVWSYFSKRERKINIDKFGYTHLLFNGKNTRKNYSIHKLVALHFIPNPNKYTQINHKDGNKLNNNVENLEWCTIAENNKHARVNGLQNIKGIKNPRACISEEQVRQIRNIKKLYPNFTYLQIGKIAKCSRDVVGGIVKNKTWKHIK